MKQLFLFGWTVLLFIICTPGFLLEPSKYKLLGMLIHSLIFTILYFILYNHMSSIIEGLTQKSENTNDKYEEKKTKIYNELKKIEKDNLSIEEQINKTQKLFDENFKDWSQEEITKFQTKYDTFFKNHFDIGDNISMEYVLNNASPEKIKFIDSLSLKQQEALEKIYLTMSQETIDKVVNLDNEQFKQILNDIINKD